MMNKNFSPEVIRQRMAHYCSQSERSKSDVLKKLSIFPLSQVEKDAIIEFLEEEGFIDELRFAKAFVSDKLRFEHWGKIKIKHALKIKNIEEKNIHAALSSIDEDIYRQIITEELKKKLKSLPENLDAYVKKHKLFQFGYQRGFESHYLEEVIDNIL